MANLLLHAIASSDSAATGAGLRGQRLVVVTHGELSAYASCFDRPSGPFRRADLLEHHALVSRVDALLGAVLPARFPTWFDQREALRAELERRDTKLVEALERVRGRAELAVTAVWNVVPDEAPPRAAATPGKKYLLGRQQAFMGSDRRRTRAQALADVIDKLVGADLVEARHHLCPSAAVALSSALFIARANAETVKNNLLREEPDVRILVNGPWPPYTFASVV